MTTTDTTLLIILTSLLSVFILVCIAVAVTIYKLVRALQAVAVKAESVVDSVEAAADVFKDATGKMAMLKLIRNIVDLVHTKKGGKK
jgi:uncharacterized membrane protein